MPGVNLELLGKLLGKDILTEFNLDKFSEENKKKAEDKIEERLQIVLLEIFLDKMTEQQFMVFKEAVEKEKETIKIQKKMTELMPQIDGLKESLQQGLAKEIEELKKIVNI